MLTREERPCVGLAIGETQDYSSWGDLSSSCNPILRCRMNRRQWSLLYSSSAITTSISISNNSMCNRMTAMAIIQSYKYVRNVDGIIRHLIFLSVYVHFLETPSPSIRTCTQNRKNQVISSLRA